MSVKDIDKLRTEAREVGGELHVVKNTLVDIALKNIGFENTRCIFDEASIVAFAFEDAPPIAKIVDDASKSDSFKIKGGFMDGAPIEIRSNCSSLAKLPPLPQMRATLLALIQTPATQLVRTISEPARQVAAVDKSLFREKPGSCSWIILNLIIYRR